MMISNSRRESNRIHIINDEGTIVSMHIEETIIIPDSKEEKPPNVDSSMMINNNQPTDDWFPITRSRRGNSWTATFHLLSSGIGTQALSLPLALVYLGWYWGILCLFVAYIWQLYTIGLLMNLHESVSGTRYSRYLELSITAFGAKLGKLFALFPVMYLSGGTCTLFIISGGRTMRLFYELLCDDDCSSKKPLTTVEWFLVFVCLAILVSLFCSDLHSVSFVSFIGAIMVVGYCTVLWIFFVAKGRVEDVVYDPSESVASDAGRVRGILTAFGIIAISFRGHNLVLEIQGTMPSTLNRSSSKPMWKGVIASYAIIAMCFFPLAIVGYWAFGNNFPTNGGMLTAMSTTVYNYTSKPLLAIVYAQVIISCVAGFQIYGMVVFDNMERAYASLKNQECPKLIRMGIRILYGGFTFFISVALPFLPSLALIIGGIALHLTFGYPCLMWIAIKKPPMRSVRWWLNIGLGFLGTGLSVLVVVGAVWNLVCRGLDANFFNPR